MSSSLVTTLFSLLSLATPQDAPAGDKAAIELKVKELYAAVAGKSWQALRACFLPDSVWVQPGGIVQKADEVIGAYEAGKMLGTAEEPSKIEVRVYEDLASAWVTSHDASAQAGTEKGQPKGGEGATQGVDLFLLARRDGSWKVVSLVSTLPAAAAVIAPPVTHEGEPTKEGEAAAATAAAAAAESKEPTEPVAILTTTQGTIAIHLFAKDAPETTKNFVELVKADQYNRTYFHRVSAGKLIQGGDFNTRDDDPTNDGNGGFSYKGPGTTLKFEKNDHKHERGSVSMVRDTKDPDSAKSQFFILLAPAKTYDGLYTVFGKVIEGIEVAEAISKQPGKKAYSKIGGVNPDEHQKITASRIEDWPLSKIEETEKKGSAKPEAPKAEGKTDTKTDGKGEAKPDGKGDPKSDGKSEGQGSGGKDGNG